METDRYYAFNKAQVNSFGLWFVFCRCYDCLLGWDLAQEDIVCTFWFIWEISVDGHTRGPAPRELGIETGISAFRPEMHMVWKCDRMVNTLLLWTVNVVFIPGSLVLEEASFTRDHSYRFNSWLDTWMSEIVSATKAQLLHLWLIWPSQNFKIKTSEGKGNLWGQYPCGF